MTIPVLPTPPDVTATAAAAAASFFFQLSFFSRGGFNFNIGFGGIADPTGRFELELAMSPSYGRFWGIMFDAANAGPGADTRAGPGAAAVGDGDGVGVEQVVMGGAAGLGMVVLS